jgi:hypothetical protein
MAAAIAQLFWLPILRLFLAAMTAIWQQIRHSNCGGGNCSDCCEYYGLRSSGLRLPIPYSLTRIIEQVV